MEKSLYQQDKDIEQQKRYDVVRLLREHEKYQVCFQCGMLWTIYYTDKCGECCGLVYSVDTLLADAAIILNKKGYKIISCGIGWSASNETIDASIKRIFEVKLGSVYEYECYWQSAEYQEYLAPSIEPRRAYITFESREHLATLPKGFCFLQDKYPLSLNFSLDELRSEEKEKEFIPLDFKSKKDNYVRNDEESKMLFTSAIEEHYDESHLPHVKSRLDELGKKYEFESEIKPCHIDCTIVRPYYSNPNVELERLRIAADVLEWAIHLPDLAAQENK